MKCQWTTCDGWFRLNTAANTPPPITAYPLRSGRGCWRECRRPYGALLPPSQFRVSCSGTIVPEPAAARSRDNVDMSTRRGGGRPRDARIDERVLAAARKLLAAKGLRAMTLDAVADDAGVSRSAIYRRWASSDELVLDVLDHALGQLPGPDPTVASEAFWSDVREGLRVAV